MKRSQAGSLSLIFIEQTVLEKKSRVGYGFCYTIRTTITGPHRWWQPLGTSHTVGTFPERMKILPSYVRFQLFSYPTLRSHTCGSVLHLVWLYHGTISANYSSLEINSPMISITNFIPVQIHQLAIWHYLLCLNKNFILLWFLSTVLKIIYITTFNTVFFPVEKKLWHFFNPAMPTPNHFSLENTNTASNWTHPIDSSHSRHYRHPQ